jgi:hypothetical protein
LSGEEQGFLSKNMTEDLKDFEKTSGQSGQQENIINLAASKIKSAQN